MKNLVELSQQELGTVIGGKINWRYVLLRAIETSGPWGAPILAAEIATVPATEEDGPVEIQSVEAVLGTPVALGINIFEIAGIYGISKGIKKLFSSSKKSKETKNI